MEKKLNNILNVIRLNNTKKICTGNKMNIIVKSVALLYCSEWKLDNF